MDKPLLYIETSIVSYLAARPSRDPVTLRNQQLTHEWWDTRREDYELLTSRFTITEAGRGDALMARRRIAFLSSITVLASGAPVLELGHALMSGVPLPAQAKEDAFHIAVSATSGVDYLLTWNCKHIANPHLKPRIERICMARGYRLPLLCTPQDLMEG